MNEFRVFLSFSVFIFSGYLIFDLIAYGFNWLLLVLSLLGFIGCHYLWPETKKHNSRWYDLLELVIELPFRMLVLMLRGLGKVSKSTDSGIDL